MQLAQKSVDNDSQIICSVCVSYYATSGLSCAQLTAAIAQAAQATDAQVQQQLCLVQN